LTNEDDSTAERDVVRPRPRIVYTIRLVIVNYPAIDRKRTWIARRTNKPGATEAPGLTVMI
jgi:hypothetical protein